MQPATIFDLLCGSTDGESVRTTVSRKGERDHESRLRKKRRE